MRAFRSFFARHPASDMLGFQLAFDVTGDPAFPEKAAFEAARELGLPVTTHAGVWGATNDDGIRLMHENGFMTPQTVYVHAATLSHRLLPADRRHRRHRLGVNRVRAKRRAGLPADLAGARHDIPVALSMDTSVWWSGDLFSAMRTTLGADRSREHLEAHVKRRHRHQLPPARRARRGLGHPRRGPRAGPDDLGSLEPGKKADVVLIKNDDSPVSFPLLNPYGHVAFQAQRGDVHTVLVDGQVVKHDAPAGRGRPGRGPPHRRGHGRLPAV